MNKQIKKDKEKSNKYKFFTWDKELYIRKKIEKSRNIDWYIKKYKHNLKLSLYIVIIAFLLNSLSFFVLQSKKQNTRNYITSTSGEIIQYKMTKEKRIELKNALTSLSKKSNQSKNTVKRSEDKLKEKG